MATATFRAVGRIKGLTKKPLLDGDTVSLDPEAKNVMHLVAIGALVPVGAAPSDTPVTPETPKPTPKPKVAKVKATGQ
jgi:hypothetical protein